ncbi:MAG: hypothetical protein HRT74_01235 [Flavobacteriales bacterium]|nr:hypothetical protein [Flavobacteriales bacterium]
MKLLTFISAILLSCTLSAQLISIEIEEEPIEEPALTTITNALGATPTTYRIFAAFPDDYELLTLYGVEGEPWTLTSTEPFYQDSFGGPTTLDINPFEVALQPSVAYDSWFTIGDVDSLDNQLITLSLTNAFELWDNGADIQIDDPFGSSIFVPSLGGNAQNNPDPNGRVLIAQLTTAGVATGCLSLQIRRLNEDGTIFDPPGDDVFEDVLENICFTTEPSPDCTGDLTEDGIVNVDDMLILLADFGCNENCVADLDGDDVVNVSDVLVFLVAFGAICAE